jgi:thiol-disulfide isomerase/thioredoxin
MNLRRKNTMRLVPVISVFVVGALATLFAVDRVRAAPEIGEAAPALVLTALDGTSIDLGKLRGKVVLVNYWATWCAPCRKEMPVLDAFYRRHREQNFELIGISIDFARDAAKMRRAATPLVYPTAWINDISVNGFGQPEGVPVTYVIDGEGIIRDKFIAVPNKLLNDVVVPLLAK